MEILIYAGVIIVIFVIYKFNTFINLRNKMKQSKSSIDIYLTQRFDLIPNLIECVKAYSDYEKKTLETIIELRNVYINTKNLDAGKVLATKMNSLIAIAEEIVELKTDKQFKILQKSLIKVESQLQAARRIYNGDVTLYNTTIQTFPNNIIAWFCNMKPAEIFVIDEYKAQNIEVEV